MPKFCATTAQAITLAPEKVLIWTELKDTWPIADSSAPVWSTSPDYLQMMQSHGFNPSEEDLAEMIKNVDKNRRGNKLFLQ